jgi:hypothetical protein
MAYKKTDEAWFGDTFDRGATLYYEAEDGSTYNMRVKNLTMSSSPYSIDTDACGKITCTCDLANNTDGAVYTIAKNANASSNQIEIESLSDKIRKIQAQISDLKQSLETKTVRDDLRSALKTLHYKREVE